MKARIGLEVHVQLTEAGTKLFCNCKSNYRGLPPNTNVCPVCLGLPGALPVPSRKAVELAAAAAVALGCKPASRIVFTRKHYFYPDLPKNYQITQYERVGGSPVCNGGVLEYLDPDTWTWHRTRIRRVQLEEDPGRSIYPEGGITRSPIVLVDYNRSGVPLLEIVTEPDFHEPRQARAFVEYLLLTLEYIGAVNPRLEGAFRVDANISLPGGERVEVKNIGSTLEVEKALRYEMRRQHLILEAGGRVERETRHWDHTHGVTKPLRRKEVEEEYLYMPEPDIPPVEITPDLLAKAYKLAKDNPRNRLEAVTSQGVPLEIAWSIVSTKPAADAYQEALPATGDPRLLARLIGVDYKGKLREAGKQPEDTANWPPPATLAQLVNLVKRGEYPYEAIRGIVLERLAENPKAVLEAILPPKAENLETIIEQVIREHPRAVQDYHAGRRKALDFLVGQAIRSLGRQAVDPRTLREKIRERLETLARAKE